MCPFCCSSCSVQCHSDQSETAHKPIRKRQLRWLFHTTSLPLLQTLGRTLSASAQTRDAHGVLLLENKLAQTTTTSWLLLTTPRQYGDHLARVVSIGDLPHAPAIPSTVGEACPSASRHEEVEQQPEPGSVRCGRPEVQEFQSDDR